MGKILYGLLPFKETREGGLILERGLIVIKMFSDSLLQVFLRSSLANVESKGYLLELCFLLGLEGTRVHSRYHRVRGVANDDSWDNGGSDEGQYEPNQHQQIAQTRNT